VDGHCAAWPTAAPDRCPRGAAHWTRQELKAALPDFAKVYAARPIKQNINGMGANHAFSLWFTARSLKPKYVIESGVYHGQSTWLLRQAVGPQAAIYSLDPEASRDLVYRAQPPENTRYFLGQDFRDVGKMNWDSLIAPEDRNRTLVMLDDHMSCIRRVQELLANGFVHLWYDDNWRIGSDCYSFSWVCASLPQGMVQVPYKDAFVAKNITVEEHDQNWAYLQARMETYFEFPAIYDGCKTGGPSLLDGPAELAQLGLPKVEDEVYGYWTLHPPYVHLVSAGMVDRLVGEMAAQGFTKPGAPGWSNSLLGWLHWLSGRR